MSLASPASKLSESLDAVRISPRFGSAAEKCEGCSKSVYHAERVIGPASRVYHRACLKCVECGKTLTQGALREHDADPYCAPCHGKKFGPKGFGFGGSMGGDYVDRYSPSPTRSPSYKASVTTRSDKDILADAQAAINSPVRGFKDETPTKPPPLKETSLASNNGSTSLTPTKPDSRPRTPKLLERSNSSSGSTGKTFSIGGTPDKCRRCGDTVYFAEQIVAAGNKWHKRCLRCATCSKTLDPGNLYVSSDSDGASGDLPYCKKCHQQLSGLADTGYALRPSMF